MDLIIKNAKLIDSVELVDIAIEKGKIIAIENSASKKFDGVKAKEIINASGKIVSPPFIDPHVHLDAVLSVGSSTDTSAGSPRYNISGTLLEGIAIWKERKETILTKDIIKENAKKAIMWAVANGVQYIRTHADSTDKTLKTVEALVEVKEEVKEVCDIQIVAFPQDGIFTYTDNDKLIDKAMSMGCDVVGGIPHNELTREDGVRSVEYCFNLADKYNALIDIHCDETGDERSRFVEVIAKESILRGNGNRVSASHTTSMHNWNNDYALKMMGIFKRSKINFITNPFDNSVLQNRTDGYPRRRGHTRVDQLLDSGINVSIGHDSVMDPWYPMGKYSMLMAANLLMHTAHLSGYNQITELFKMITSNSAITMNIENEYGIKVGNNANIIILNCYTVFDCLRLMPECLYSIKNGSVIAKTKQANSEVFFNNKSYDVDFRI